LTSGTEYLAFFASKTVEMVRAPDSFVYPAPGNIIETLLIAPLEYVLLEACRIKLVLTFKRLVLSPKAYAKVSQLYVFHSSKIC
jgi:hypothetical protein